MLAELRDDNKVLVAKMRAAHALCDVHNELATAELLEVWINEAERRHLVPLLSQPDPPSELKIDFGDRAGRKPSISKERFKMARFCRSSSPLGQFEGFA